MNGDKIRIILSYKEFLFSRLSPLSHLLQTSSPWSPLSQTHSPYCRLSQTPPPLSFILSSSVLTMNDVFFEFSLVFVIPVSTF